MLEPKLISPMLDNFAMGGPISEHDGVCCCPAMENDTNNKYIVKIISVPASQKQLDALLLTGAFSSADAALEYFKSVSDDVVEEVNILNRLSLLEGFLPYSNYQVVPMEDGTGFDIYLLGSYKRTLEKHFRRQPLTHLGAVNLGLDLCASLTVCRRSGYLYVDLKPSNIFVTQDQEYRIGDLGFVRLDHLQYASLPDKYRSAYTAPEITDAFSSLNTTIDIYAAGLILYQAYNNGELPFNGDTAPEEPFAPPMYADYEMSEIILKACAPDPKDRWQSPAEMGQALVSYMQRNGVNDTPIVPQAQPEPMAEMLSDVQTDISEEITDTEPEAVITTIQEQEIEPESAVLQEPEEIQTNTEEQPISEEPDNVLDVSSDEDDAHEPDNSVLTTQIDNAEEDFENLSFLSDEDLISEDSLDYDDISQELSEILSQADDLAAHTVPSPAVAPDPIEVPIPEPIVRTPEDTYEVSSIENAVAETVQQTLDGTADAVDSAEEVPAAAKPKRHWLRNILICFIILGLLAAGAYVFQSYYFVPIDSIELDGKEDSLSVFVKTDIDESILTVVCSDAHGNQYTEPVINGVATFSELVPSTGYNIKVVVSGFHRVTGDATSAYSTPVQTNIVQFNAVTGAEDGSVILGFTVDGPDSEHWNVHYFADGEEEKVVTFPSHMVTLTGLTVGKEYTFKLVPETDLYVTGANEMQYTANKLVFAENLEITSCMDQAISVRWTTPADTTVENWTVRCYNDKEYNETIITSETSVIFENLDHTDSFTIEVTAAGMSMSSRVFVAENTITVKDFQIDDSDPTKLLLSWVAGDNAPDNWHLTYTVNGFEMPEVISDGNSAEITPVIPNAEYQFTLQDTNGSPVIDGEFALTTKAAEAYSCEYEGYSITQDDMVFSMVLTPPYQDWNRYYLSSSDYTTTFAVGENASFLVRLTKSYGVSDDTIVVLFVIRDSEGNLYSISTQEHIWSDMWYRNYGELDLPALPDAPGEYTLDIYFNGMIAATQNFTIYQE